MRNLNQVLAEAFQKQGWCISMYLPLQHPDSDSRQDQIRSRHLMQEAQKKLHAYDVRPAEADKLLKPAQEFFDSLWFEKSPLDALALLTTPAQFHTFFLPYPVQELVVVAPRLHITPLLPLLERSARFFVLALSQNQNSLWRVEDTIEPIEMEGVPANLAQAVSDKEFGKVRNLRPLPRSVGGGGRQAISYGQGGGAEDLKQELLPYVRQVETGVAHALHNENAPLVVACVNYLYPLYRQVNTYNHLLEDFIVGSPDKAAPTELVARATKLLQPYFEQGKRQAQTRYARAVAAKRATNDLEKILPAAHQGRIELLFVQADTQRCGSFDEKARTLHLHPDKHGDQDLMNLAALYTLENGGAVYTLPSAEMPNDAALAAVLRF